jgi:hypothetical protein
MKSAFLERTLSVPTSLPVVTVNTATVNGVGVDRLNYLSAALEFISGVCPSVPTGVVVAIKVQDSDSQGSGFADFITTIPSFGTAADLSAASVGKYWDLDLTGARRYIRVVATITFTGGTNPSMVWSSAFILGDKNAEPAGAAIVYGP